MTLRVQVKGKPRGVLGRRWTQEEVDALNAGVRRYGHRWRTIKEDAEFRRTLANRTTMDLKDKHKNLRSPRRRSNLPARNYILLDAAHKPLVWPDGAGYVTLGIGSRYGRTLKYPRDAAIKAARLDVVYHSADDNGPCIMYIVEVRRDVSANEAASLWRQRNVSTSSSSSSTPTSSASTDAPLSSASASPSPQDRDVVDDCMLHAARVLCAAARRGLTPDLKIVHTVRGDELESDQSPCEPDNPNGVGTVYVYQGMRSIDASLENTSLHKRVYRTTVAFVRRERYNGPPLLLPPVGDDGSKHDEPGCPMPAAWPEQFAQHALQEAPAATARPQPLGCADPAGLVLPPSTARTAEAWPPGTSAPVRPSPAHWSDGGWRHQAAVYYVPARLMAAPVGNRGRVDQPCQCKQCMLPSERLCWGSELAFGWRREEPDDGRVVRPRPIPPFFSPPSVEDKGERWQTLGQSG